MDMGSPAASTAVASRRWGWLGLLAAWLAFAPTASALEALDGKVQVHGYAESVMRGISAEFTDDYDLSQWQWIVNIEFEFEIAPDGFGPFTSITAFTRVEGRYDCVWNNGCALFNEPPYGDATQKMPLYLTDGLSNPFSGTTRVFNRLERFQRNDGTSSIALEAGTPDRQLLIPDQRISSVSQGGAFAGLFETAGPDGDLFTEDDPARATFQEFSDYSSTFLRTRGSVDGFGNQIIVGYKPGERPPTLTEIADRPFPYSTIENSAIGLSLPPGANPGPFQSVPLVQAGETNDPTVARGLYIPSPGLIQFLNERKFGEDLIDYGETELAFNRGASQRDEQELKEAYLDVEMFDGRLWLRLGKQTIVWGKTELFRNQDQFNPQDLGLASLPSLEESRINLWSVRATWSFYDVGPLEDVRLELAAIFDDFEPTDLGRCGEPYAPLPVCGINTGIFAGRAVGFGLMGRESPPSWWESSNGWEFGGRLEWRWQRFSFALTNFYGFSDTPTAEPIFNFERNVDPETGRPRTAWSRLPCDPEGDRRDTRGCLGDTDRLRFLSTTRGATATDEERDQVLRNQSSNAQFFATICSATIGATTLIPGLENECGFRVFSSPIVLVESLGLPSGSLGIIGIGDEDPISLLINILLGGSTLFESLAFGLLIDGVDALATFTLSEQALALANAVTGVPLNIDTTAGAPSSLFGLYDLDNLLTREQQALIGCGEFYGTNCDSQGLDLLNAEASAILQSFPGFDGTPIMGFDTFDRGQPGTLGFDGGPVCTRFERGRTFVLPGCRGPEDDGYEPDIDGRPFFDVRRQLFTADPRGLTGVGTDDLFEFDRVAMSIGKECDSVQAAVNAGGGATGADVRLIHPYTCEPFRSEMAAFSYNLMILAVLFSTERGADGNDVFEPDEFDPDRPFAKNRCSLRQPQHCRAIKGLLGTAGNRRNDVLAGGNGRFGRRDFLWHGAQQLVLTYPKRNILGFSMDFAEDLSKTNWSLEFTWVEGDPFSNRNDPNGFSLIDTYNLTVSIDRPTFINFLNVNRTFFFNTQVFFSYRPEHTPAFSAEGPWNVLGVFTVFTGYFQDRLNMAATFVYDLQSRSGAILPSANYRFNQDTTLQFGMAFFYGRQDRRIQFLNPQAVGQNVGRDAYRSFVENGLAAVRDRDEIFLRLRWTF